MASSSNKLECIGCDTLIDPCTLSASARNVGAGFCDTCVVSQAVDSEVTGPQLDRTYHLRDVPVLNDIDGGVSQLLVNSVGQSNEAIALALAQNLPPPTRS